MLTHLPRTVRTLRGPRIIKTSRGIISCAAVVGTTILLAPAMASAQATPLECLPGSTGPAPGDATPYAGGMCDLGSLRDDNLGGSNATTISPNGRFVVGAAETDNGQFAAFWWDTASGTKRNLGSLRTDDQGGSNATAISANGRFVVGDAT